MIQISTTTTALFFLLCCFIALFVGALADQPTTLNNGRYELFHFKNEKGAQYSFVLNLPKFHQEQVSVFAAPFGCDSPINIYASVDKIPSSSSYDFVHKGLIGETGFLFANLTQQGTPKTEKFFIVVQSVGAPGELCSVNFMAYVRHTQHLIVLENAVPQWGGFHVDHESPEKPHIHWYEFDLGKNVDPDNLGLAFYITSIEGQVAQEHYTFNAYVANNNARPTPQNHQWASLTLSDGDSFVQVTKADLRYKPYGKYYIGVQLVENPRLKKARATDKALIHYTVTAQVIKKERQLKPILLFNDQPQIGVSSEVEHKTSFLAYIDPEIVSKNVQLVPTIRTGAIQIYASSTTSHPSKSNFEFQGDGFKPITMSFSRPTFVYFTVETYKGVISAYDLEFKRQ